MGPAHLDRADLLAGAPEEPFDLVCACYVHPSGSSVRLVRRLADWVGLAGTPLILDHRQSAGETADPARSGPAEAVRVPWQDLAAELDPERWQIVVTEPHGRPEGDDGDAAVNADDSIGRAARHRRGPASRGDVAGARRVLRSVTEHILPIG